MQPPKIVSPAEWLAARKALLDKEKALTRQRDALAEERRRLPWVKLDKNYVFDSSDGPRTLSELFGPRDQLVVYHFMFGPDWKEGCPTCSVVCDHLDRTVVHLAQRDVSVAVVSRARVDQIEAFKRRMGWTFTWVSSFANDFNFDFHVSFRPADIASGKVVYNFEPVAAPGADAPNDLPGTSVFYKDRSGALFHTYSMYARGGEPLMNVYNFLDLVPKGRDEDGLPWTTAWVKHHDRYGT
jgi:predicted dithiol-disulfide oxidoreductase (DUF899 family)